MNDERENTDGDNGRVQKQIWRTPLLIMADVSISGAGKATETTETQPNPGPAS
ncbi:MAG: hypothetical protein Q7R30_09320 [Acidobacteriota bacterium]|nr:hypothetical protein [Acidobacteriota bacterium]